MYNPDGSKLFYGRGRIFLIFSHYNYFLDNGGHTGDTSITFNPIEVADNMKKSGGFIPGIRPGKPTQEYLNGLLNYIVLIGAIGLLIVAVIPIAAEGISGAQLSTGGTSLIIVVGVVLETIKNVESKMVVRSYKGFLID